MRGPLTIRDPNRSPTQLSRARRLRREGTDAERLLWKHLRSGQLGEKFRRQHRVGPYIADFFCVPLALAIELDGGQHFSEEGRERDARRTQALEKLGIRVVRFSNADVLTQTEAVLVQIQGLLSRDR